MDRGARQSCEFLCGWHVASLASSPRPLVLVVLPRLALRFEAVGALDQGADNIKAADVPSVACLDIQIVWSFISPFTNFEFQGLR